MNMVDDKQIECERYEVRAQDILNSLRAEELSTFGSQSFPEYLRAPYEYYESVLKKRLNSDHKVLEIGAGMGLHTVILVKSGATVIATDISGSALKVLNKRLKRSLNAEVLTRVADMEKLPFEDEALDFVVSAGSLSYGDNDLVLNEVYRILKPGGNFICIDSLNHNPIYNINRLVHVFRGARTKSTLRRMPTLSLIEKYKKKFDSCEVKFFGSIVWAFPMLKIFGDRRASKIIDGFDNLFTIKRSAFKFVMCVEKGSY